MKLEYLASGSDPCPLIRLSDFQPDEVAQLRKACKELAAAQIVEYALHDQPWAEPVQGCRFIWRKGPRDIGVRQPQPSSCYELHYSEEAWLEVADKLLPFVEGSSGFNWLSNEGEINVLISRN